MHHPRPFPQKHAIQVFLTPGEREQLNENYNGSVVVQKKVNFKIFGYILILRKIGILSKNHFKWPEVKK